MLNKGKIMFNDEYYILVKKETGQLQKDDMDKFLDFKELEVARKCKEPDQVIVKVRTKWEVVEE